MDDFNGEIVMNEYSRFKLKYFGSGFYWQSLAYDEDGFVWEGWFDSFTKLTKWVKTDRKMKEKCLK